MTKADQITDEMVEAGTEVLAPMAFPWEPVEWKVQVCRRMFRAALSYLQREG